VDFSVLLSDIPTLAIVIVGVPAVKPRRERELFAANGYVVVAANYRGSRGRGRRGRRSAEATLAERFAQGDIDEKEYRARLEVIRANAYPQPPAK